MPRKIKLRIITPHATLYRDPSTGIAWVEDTGAGIGHSAHPNISARGSISGMRRTGAWAMGDRTVRSHGWIYNIDRISVSDELDKIAAAACQCGGRHPEPEPFDVASAGVKAASDHLLSFAPDADADAVYFAAIRYTRAIDAAKEAAEAPYRASPLQEIADWAAARSGNPEDDERALTEIAAVCERAGFVPSQGRG